MPSVATRGPWDPGLQHGGPPSALMADALDRHGDSPNAWQLVRLTVELMRPIGMNPLRVEVEPLREGKRAQWLRASLWEDQRELGRAHAVRVRTVNLDLPEPLCRPAPSPPPPDACAPFVFPFFECEQGYHTAVEIRIARGQWARGPAAAWLRPRVPLVEGLELTPLQRVVITADASNGVCPALSTDSHTFINPDLTIHLRRPLRGSWVGLDASSLAEPAGVGLVHATVHDIDGEVGHCLQSLVVAARR